MLEQIVPPSGQPEWHTHYKKPGCRIDPCYDWQSPEFHKCWKPRNNFDCCKETAPISCVCNRNERTGNVRVVRNNTTRSQYAVRN